MNEAYKNNQFFYINSYWGFDSGCDIIDNLDINVGYGYGLEYECQELWALDDYGLIDYENWYLLKESYKPGGDSTNSFCVWVEQVVEVL